MNGRAWTDAELRHLRRHYRRRTVPRLAAELGRTPRAVEGKVERMGLSKGMRKGPRYGWHAADLELLAREYPRQGAAPVAAALGRSPTAVRIQAKRQGLRVRPLLSAEAEDLLWQMREEPGAPEFFARQFGVALLAVERRLAEMGTEWIERCSG